MSASTSSPRGALFLGAWLSAAIGFGLGWLGAGLGEPSPSPLAAKPVERQPVESPSGTEANRIDTAAAISAIDPRSLADAIEREFPRVVRSGTGSIEGVLIDEEDRPVGGAMLILEPVLPPPGRSIRERLLHAREVEARTRRRATDPSGLFEFRDLPADGVWSIRGEEIQLYAGAANRRDLRPGEQLELRTPSTSFRFPRATLPVSVRLHGEEVERAQIVCVPESSVKHGVWLVAPGAGGGAPARDEISLGPGQHRYVVRAFLDAELASAPTVVTAEDEGPVVLELEPCTSVFGRLVLPRANDATLSPSLWIHPLEEGGDPKEIDPLKAGVRIQPQQGGFRVVGAEPGRYVVGLTLGDSAILHRWAIDVRPGPQEITLALDAIPDDSLITVSVIDPRGEPMNDISYFRFSTELPNGRTRSSSSQPAARDGTTYQIRLGPAEIDALAAKRRVRMSVSDARWGEVGTELTGAPGPIVLRYEPQAELEVVLRGYLGSGLEGWLDVEIHPVSSSDEGDDREPSRALQFYHVFHREPRPDFLGESRFHRLPVEPVRVIVTFTQPWKNGKRFTKYAALTRDVVLVPGPNLIELDTPEVFDLELEIDEELRRELLDLYVVSSTGEETKWNYFEDVEPLERFRLPRGEYVVRIGRAESRVVLDSNRRIELRKPSSP